MFVFLCRHTPRGRARSTAGIYLRRLKDAAPDGSRGTSCVKTAQCLDSSSLYSVFCAFCDLCFVFCLPCCAFWILGSGVRVMPLVAVQHSVLFDICSAFPLRSSFYLVGHAFVRCVFRDVLVLSSAFFVFVSCVCSLRSVVCVRFAFCVRGLLVRGQNVGTSFVCCGLCVVFCLLCLRSVFCGLRSVLHFCVLCSAFGE